MSKKNIYYPKIDSLRAIACIIVILFHSSTEHFLNINGYFNPFKGGYVGVDLFFVLSGFLITIILIKQYVDSGTIRILSFYKRRILRLYPPIIIAVVIFLFPLLFFDKIKALSNIFFVMTYTGDIVMVFRRLFPVLEYPLFFSHCWSLAIEEQFYIFYPVLLLFLLNYQKKRKKNIVFTFLFYNILFIAIVVFGTILLKSWFYKFFLWRFFQIFLGCYLALIYSKDYRENFYNSNMVNFTCRITKSLFTNLIFFTVMLSIFIFFIVFDVSVNTYGFKSYIITIASGVLIINAVAGKILWYNNFLENKILQYIGRISYGLYLYHYPALNIKELLGLDLSRNISYSIFYDIIVIALVFIISSLSYRYIEKPILAYKNKL